VEFLLQLLKAITIVVSLVRVIPVIPRAIVTTRSRIRRYQRLYRRKRLTKNQTQSDGKQQAQLYQQLPNPRIEESQSPTGEGIDQYQFKYKEDDKVFRPHNE